LEDDGAIMNYRQPDARTSFEEESRWARILLRDLILFDIFNQ
jgi:hypothetical protein